MCLLRWGAWDSLVHSRNPKSVYWGQFEAGPGFLKGAGGLIKETDQLSTLGSLVCLFVCLFVCLEKDSLVIQAGLESVQNTGIWDQREAVTWQLGEKQPLW